MTTTTRCALSFALLLSASATAQAQSATGEAGRSYRSQVLVTDAALIGAAVVGFSLEGRDGALNYIPSNVLMGVGSAGYFLGVPMVHLAQRRFGRAALSIALRTALPVLGAAIGAQLSSCTPDEWLCGLEEIGKGMAVGAVTAAVVDDLLIESTVRADVEPERTPTAARKPSGPRFAPRLIATPNVAMVGINGQF